jgi:hypothetical protein
MAESSDYLTVGRTTKVFFFSIFVFAIVAVVYALLYGSFRIPRDDSYLRWVIGVPFCLVSIAIATHVATLCSVIIGEKEVTQRALFNERGIWKTRTISWGQVTSVSQAGALMRLFAGTKSISLAPSLFQNPNNVVDFIARRTSHLRK